ncbi:MAG: hypothetical protein WBA97_16945 [Actinophytocola sp.]|uniref:hypothetical protein n=1 Tax=Actinophytocola sp. TaxID=1872138 RepID=UPI003C730C14
MSAHDVLPPGSLDVAIRALVDRMRSRPLPPALPLRWDSDGEVRPAFEAEWLAALELFDRGATVGHRVGGELVQGDHVMRAHLWGSALRGTPIPTTLMSGETD